MEKGKKSTLIRILRAEYPNAKCTLAYNSPLELLIATILAAQCTDARVNQVTASLFKKYPKTEDFANASQNELMEDIKSTGFYRNKAKNIINCCQKIINDYQGKIPSGMEKLTALPGVGRKTANVILGNAFDIPGVVVDTHVRRLSQRLGLTVNSDPTKIEFDLQKLIPEEEWVMFGHRIVEHGRKICQARRPKCDICRLASICPRIGVNSEWK